MIIKVKTPNSLIEITLPEEKEIIRYLHKYIMEVVEKATNEAIKIEKQVVSPPSTNH